MSTCEINCIALIGKQNNPLFIKNFSTSHPDLKYHYIAHTSIDVIEERAIGTVATGTKNLDSYLGLLYAMEDLAVYGYITNTRVKFVVVVSVTDGLIRDAEMKAIFKKIHAAYLSQVCNPFYNLYSQQSMNGKAFVSAIEAIGANARVTMDV
ncbi:Sedlin [Dichotomocladium elegans]|nr:Sedlin [Dichotomocladium elegans]